MQPNYSFYQGLLRNTPFALLHDKEVKRVSVITAVKINVHSFHLHFTRAQTNKTTHKHTNAMAYAYTYIPPHNVM